MVLDSRFHHGPGMMWALIAIRAVLGCGRGAYIVQYMAYNVTSRENRVTLSILVAMATNLGMCLGPYQAALVLDFLGGSATVPSVFARTSAILYVMAAVWTLL